MAEEQLFHIVKKEDFLRMHGGDILSAQKHMNPIFEAIERHQEAFQPPLHPDLKRLLRVMQATETLGVKNFGDPRDRQGKTAAQMFFHHDDDYVTNDFDVDDSTDIGNITDAMELPIDTGETFIGFYDEQTGQWIPANQVRVRHVRTVEPEIGSYPLENESSPPAVFPFAFLRIDYDNSTFGGAKIPHVLMGNGYEDGVLYNIKASHENYIPVGTELEAYHIKGRWYVDYSKGEESTTPMKMIRLIVDGSDLAYPNNQCVLPGKIVSSTGLTSDMCANHWVDSVDIWVYVSRANELLPLICSGQRVALAYKALDAFSVSSDTRQLFVLHDPQVDPPIVGIFDPDSGDDAFIDHASDGRIALIEATGASAPFALTVPESPTYIRATNQYHTRIWRDSVVFIQPARMNSDQSAPGAGAYEFQIIAAYSAKIMRGTASADFLHSTPEITVENLTSLDGHHPLSGGPGNITARNFGFWGANGDAVRVCWNDNTLEWDLIGVEPAKYIVYRGILAAQLTDPTANVPITPQFAIGTNYSVASFGSPLAINEPGIIGDAGIPVLAIYDMLTGQHHAINAKHQLFEPLVNLEIDTVAQKVKGHQKFISVFTYSQPGENFIYVEDTYECDSTP